jgi:hypothetical protein
VVSSGVLTVDGARAYSNLNFGPGTSLEFRATFSVAQFQNIGFASNGDFGAPWIVIGEGSSTDGVYARMDNGTSIRLSTTTLGTPHVYRIDWTTSGFAFYVDGVLASTVTRQVTSNMVVMISDYNTGGGTLAVDWVRVTPYLSPCTFTSRVFDAGRAVDWLELNWTGSAPTSTTAAFETRSGNTMTPGSGWTNWQAVGSPVSSPDNQYIQYRLTMTATNTMVTPVVESVTLTYRTPENPTGVEIIDFRGARMPDRILIQWTSLMEVNLLGFNLYRAASPDGSRLQLNQQLISAQSPGGIGEMEYMFVDTGAEPTETSYYWLEAVDVTGEVKLHGPITVLAASSWLFLPISIK